MRRSRFGWSLGSGSRFEARWLPLILPISPSYWFHRWVAAPGLRRSRLPHGRSPTGPSLCRGVALRSPFPRWGGARVSTTIIPGPAPGPAGGAPRPYRQRQRSAALFRRSNSFSRNCSISTCSSRSRTWALSRGATSGESRSRRDSRIRPRSTTGRPFRPRGAWRRTSRPWSAARPRPARPGAASPATAGPNSSGPRGCRAPPTGR